MSTQAFDSSYSLSICIVNFNAGDLLLECVRSIYTHPFSGKFEVIVVDNAPRDGAAEKILLEFPSVVVQRNLENIGYTKGMNQALKLANGNFLVQLNPDTLVKPGSLNGLVQFLHDHPKVGICGPKVLNEDGTMQKPCRRGESTPWVVISHFTGLSRLFPKDPRFSQYLMTYMDENQIHSVDGLSGSCMMIRRELVDEIGYLDERFLMYQEDADYCLRARQAGWQVYYYPPAQIIHYGGRGGSHAQPYRAMLEWHRSYWLYYRKHHARNYPFIFNAFFYMVMGLKLSLSILGNFFHLGRFAQYRRVASRK